VIVLVRHASTDWSGVRYCGRADPPLNGRGRAEAEALAGRVAAIAGPDARLISSPRLRAVATATAIATSLGLAGPEIDDRWQEVDVGAAEGLTFDEVASRWPDLATRLAAGEMDVSWPDGEPEGALTARIRAAWMDLEEEPLTTIVVTHGGAIRVALGLAAGPGTVAPQILPPGGVATFHRGADGSWQVALRDA
jgi:broad specificity phosphatase PhoE